MNELEKRQLANAKLGEIELPFPVIIGEKEELEIVMQPTIDLKPYEFLTNNPCENEADYGAAQFIIRRIQIANVMLFAAEWIDAAIVPHLLFGERFSDNHLFDVPMLRQSQRVAVRATYTGKIPLGMKTGDEFIFKVVFRGARPSFL